MTWGPSSFIPALRIVLVCWALESVLLFVDEGRVGQGLDKSQRSLETL